jgi:Flp pilus assembly protein TadD
MREIVSWLRWRSLLMIAIATLATAPLPAQTAPYTNRSGSVIDDTQREASSSRPLNPHKNAGLVNADLLRHPLSENVRKMLRRALAAMNAGRHEEAVGQLRQTLAKYPKAAPYVHSILGVEYIKTNNFADAVKSFEVAAESFPHDPTTHYNLGVSLACAGRYDRATQEVRRALELDPKNASAQELLAQLQEQP